MKKIFGCLLFAVILALLCCACAQTPQEGSAATSAEELAPLSERMPGEGRPLRDYCLVEGGEVEEMPEFSIDILGKTFTDKDAAALQLYTADIEMETTVELHQLHWVGYRLKDILDYLDLTLEGGYMVEASDGYGLSQNIENFDDNVMIAVSRNGKSDNAPYYAPCSTWFGGGFVSDVCLIRLREE